MHADRPGTPMFDDLRQWALHLIDVGDWPSALSAARAMGREAHSVEQMATADRLLAELGERVGDTATAHDARARLVDQARLALAREPGTGRRLELLDALDRFGDLARREGDHWTVLECHGRRGRLAELRELIAEHGEDDSLLTEVCYSLRRAGEAAAAMGSMDEAYSMFEERLATARCLAAAAPGESRRVALVAAGLADLGEVAARLGDPRADGLLAEERRLRVWLAAQPGRPGAPDGLAGGLPGADTVEHLFNAHALNAQGLGHRSGAGAPVATGAWTGPDGASSGWFTA